MTLTRIATRPLASLIGPRQQLVVDRTLERRLGSGWGRQLSRDAYLATKYLAARELYPQHVPEADLRCFVCSGAPHADHAPEGHNYWSTAAAMAEAREHDAHVELAETPEARYVRQHRPY